MPPEQVSAATHAPRRDLPLASESLDYVYCCEVLHHNDPVSLRRTIEEAFRVYAEGIAADGVVIGCVDDPGVAALLEFSSKRTLRYGLSEHAQIRAINISYEHRGVSEVAPRLPDQCIGHADPAVERGRVGCVWCGGRGDQVVHELFDLLADGAVVAGAHWPPLVPRQHLDAVERGEVANGVADDLGNAPVLGAVHAEGHGIGAVAVGRPCFWASEERGGRKVGGVHGEAEIDADELAVDTYPSIELVMPVLGDPMIDGPARLEIGGEAATSSSRDVSRPEEGTGEDGEMSAGSDHPDRRR